MLTTLKKIQKKNFSLLLDFRSGKNTENCSVLSSFYRFSQQTIIIIIILNNCSITKSIGWWKYVVVFCQYLETQLTGNLVVLIC